MGIGRATERGRVVGWVGRSGSDGWRERSSEDGLGYECKYTVIGLMVGLV